MFKGRLTWKKVAVIVIVPHLIYHPLRYFATKDRDKLRTDFEQRTFTESEWNQRRPLYQRRASREHYIITQLFHTARWPWKLILTRAVHCSFGFLFYGLWLPHRWNNSVTISTWCSFKEIELSRCCLVIFKHIVSCPPDLSIYRSNVSSVPNVGRQPLNKIVQTNFLIHEMQYYPSHHPYTGT